MGHFLFELLILLYMENEVMKCIKERRSIRNYADGALPKEALQEIITAGRYAPSPENRQPWKFIVIANRDEIKRLSEETKKQIGKVLKQRWKWKRKYRELEDRQTLMFLHAVASSREDIVFHNAPAIIFILTDNGIFYDEACACAAQNMMLAAHSMGIGSCWIGFAKFLEMGDAMKEMGMPANHHISACIAFGYAENTPKAAPRKPTADVIKWVESETFSAAGSSAPSSVGVCFS